MPDGSIAPSQCVGSKTYRYYSTAQNKKQTHYTKSKERNKAFLIVSAYSYCNLIIFAQVNKKYTYRSLTALVIALSFLMTACYEDPSCDQNNQTAINTEVASSGSDASTDPDTLDIATDIEWLFTTINNDTTLLESSTYTETVGLPLDANNTQSIFLFKIRNTNDSAYYTDTIIFEYTLTELEALSINCEYAPVYKLEAYAHSTHALDSIAIYDPVINTDLTLENVTFYY